MSEEEKKIPTYTLLMLRKDEQHIEVITSSNYDKVFEKYKEVKASWAQSIKDQTPLELLSPIVTSFDPGLVYEITIKLVTETPESRYDNPYQKQMQKSGLGSMLNRRPQTTGSDLLDEGYR